MSVWTEFLRDKKFEIKDDYGIFLHEFRTPMFFSSEKDLMTYISDTDLKEILFIKFKEDENFKIFGSERKHQEIINTTEKKKFKNSFLWFIVILIGALAYHYFVKEIDIKELKLFIIIGGIFPITEMFFDYRNLNDISATKHQKFIENSIFSFWLQKSNTKFLAYLIPTILALSFGFQEILTLGKSTQFNFVNKFALIKSRLDLGEYERLLTYLFVHYNMLHISAIFGALYFLSRIFFQFYNLSLFILIFAVTGIVGGLSSVIILPQEISYGASSSVLGILGFFL
jgi:membrane associated rhomboid family serine protease